MCDDSTNDVESQFHGNKKDFIDPETTVLVGMGLWWFIKTMAQAVAGWIGIQLFKRVWDKIVGRFWGKSGEGSSKEISEEESAASSCRTLRGGRNGGRVFRSEGESD